MPQEHTARFPIKPEDCKWWQRHLCATDRMVLDTMIAFAKAARKSREGDAAKGPLIFKAAVKPTLCNAIPLTYNHTRDIIKRLEKIGWLVLVQKGQQRDDGTQEPNIW